MAIRASYEDGESQSGPRKRRSLAALMLVGLVISAAGCHSLRSLATLSLPCNTPFRGERQQLSCSLLDRVGLRGHSGTVLGQSLRLFEDIRQDVAGVAVFASGKLAQTPFYFQLSGGQSAQQGQPYLSGQVEADFLDEQKAKRENRTAESVSAESTGSSRSAATENRRNMRMPSPSSRVSAPPISRAR